MMDDSSTARTSPEGEKLDLAEVRRELEKARGPRFWRSLEELAAT